MNLRSAEHLERDSAVKMLDTIIVLGHAWSKPINEDNPKLSIAACINILAAVQLYLCGKTKYILITGGKTAGKKNKSESEKMFEYVYTMFTKEEIPPNIFFLEKKALDTGENARNIKDILKNNNFKKIGLITTSWHMNRASKIFNASKINISQKFICDEIIDEIDTVKASPFILQLQQITKLKTKEIHLLVKAFLKSSNVKRYKLKELISTLISLIDREQKFLHFITQYRI